MSLYTVFTYWFDITYYSKKLMDSFKRKLEDLLHIF